MGALPAEVPGLLAALFWGATGILIRLQGTGFPAVALNAARSSIAAVILVAAWPFFGGPREVGLAALGFLVASLVLGLGAGDSLYFEAIRRIGVARAMPISMAYPIFTTIAAVGVLGEPLTWLSALGMAAILGGVYLVAYESGGGRSRATPEASEVPGHPLVGVALAAVAAACWAGSTVALRPALREVDAATANAVRMPLAGLLLWAYAWRSGGLPRAAHLRGRSLAIVTTTGVVSALSAAFFILSVDVAGAARTAVLAAMTPVFTLPFATLVLRERVTWQVVAGALTSVGGVVLLGLEE